MEGVEVVGGAFAVEEEEAGEEEEVEGDIDEGVSLRRFPKDADAAVAPLSFGRE